MLMLRSVPYRHVVSSARLGLRACRNASSRASKQPQARTPGPRPLEPASKKATLDTPSSIVEPASKTAAPASTLRTAAPIILGTIAALAGFYVTQLFIAYNKPCLNPRISELSQQKDVAARYDETADNFDSEVGTSEALMGINKIRKRLTRMCKGHVLEVSCGTGRNLGYYDTDRRSPMDSITFIDLSKQMIDVCKKKWTALYGEKLPKTFKPTMQVRFMTGSALDPMPLAPNGQKYDTIVQTMGLCSTPTPHELLVNMAQHLNTENPDARILLLEHGRSYKDWLNHVLDVSAEKHAEIHGCWFNRDIGELVEHAAEKSGLEVVRERRKHLGTTWIFELKAEGAAEKAVAPEAKEDMPPAVAEEDANGTGWRGLLGWK